MGIVRAEWTLRMVRLAKPKRNPETILVTFRLRVKAVRVPRPIVWQVDEFRPAAFMKGYMDTTYIGLAVVLFLIESVFANTL